MPTRLKQRAGQDSSANFCKLASCSMKRSQSYVSLIDGCKKRSHIPFTKSWPRLSPSTLQFKEGALISSSRVRGADVDSDCNVVTDEECDEDASLACFYEDEIDDEEPAGKKQYICSLVEERRTSSDVNTARKLLHARDIAAAGLSYTPRLLVHARVIAKADVSVAPHLMSSVISRRPSLQHLVGPRPSVRGARMIRIVQFAAEQSLTTSLPLDRLLVLSEASPINKRA